MNDMNESEKKTVAEAAQTLAALLDLVQGFACESGTEAQVRANRTRGKALSFPLLWSDASVWLGAPSGPTGSGLKGIAPFVFRVAFW